MPFVRRNEKQESSWKEGYLGCVSGSLTKTLLSEMWVLDFNTASSVYGPIIAAFLLVNLQNPPLQKLVGLTALLKYSQGFYKWQLP